MIDKLGNGILKSLGMDQDTALVLALLLVLMQERSDFGIVFALLYVIV